MILCQTGMLEGPLLKLRASGIYGDQMYIWFPSVGQTAALGHFRLGKWFRAREDLGAPPLPLVCHS